MSKQTISEVANEKAERLLNGVAYWGAYWRCNPHRFAKDYLNIQKLKLFQIINLYEMMHSTNIINFGSRGISKTWQLALFCICKCILYPGTQIAVASKVKGQASEIITKIDTDFTKLYGWGSANLRNEISKISTSANNPVCEFKNGSRIFIVTANDNARHNRANVLIVDEFRMVDPTIITTVLKRFLTASRSPGYLNKPEYADMIERNVEVYASSAYYKSNWSYAKLKAYFANMLDDSKKYYVSALPYQIAVKEHLLSREQIEDEMSEQDFDPIAFYMEMQTLFHGESQNAFFRSEDLNKRRKIKECFHSLDIYRKRGLNVPELAVGERRILSVDIALMASKKNKNDATAMWINRAMPTDALGYKSNYVYLETFEGLTTDELGLKIMKYFYEYNCTDLVIDAAGAGMGAYDFIIKDQLDPESGKTYGALTAINNPDMAERCKVKNAKKVVWTIKASAQFNSVGYKQLRADFMNGNINLLCHEFDAEEVVKNTPSYSSMSEKEKASLIVPYVQTSMFINEAISLDYELGAGDIIKLKEKSGMRKDRVSSIMYNNVVVHELSNKLKPKTKDEIKSLVDRLPFRIRRSTSEFD